MQDLAPPHVLENYGLESLGTSVSVEFDMDSREGASSSALCQCLQHTLGCEDFVDDCHAIQANVIRRI